MVAGVVIPSIATMQGDRRDKNKKGTASQRRLRVSKGRLRQHRGESPNLRDALMTEWYLVWIDGPRGPEPQKWSSEGLWGQLGRQDVIVRFALTDSQAKLPLDQLARERPVPGK